MTSGALVLLMAACGGGATITGEVVDVTGAPLEGVVVTAVGTLCQARTDANGAFELGCNPADMLITVTQAGYISKEIELKATEVQRYDLGRVSLIGIPKAQGLFLFNGSDYATMERSLLVRDAGARRKTKTFCLDADSLRPNPVAAGSVGLFDNEYGDWRVWRVDAEGCAYRMSVDADGHWKTDYAEKPGQEAHSVAAEKEVVVLDLSPGRYFIADWDKGFFVKERSKPENVKSGDKGDARYTGYLVVAE